MRKFLILTVIGLSMSSLVARADHVYACQATDPTDVHCVLTVTLAGDVVGMGVETNLVAGAIYWTITGPRSTSRGWCADAGPLSACSVSLGDFRAGDVITLEAWAGAVGSWRVYLVTHP